MNDSGFGKIKVFNDFLGPAVDGTNIVNFPSGDSTEAVNIANNGTCRLTSHTDDNDVARVSTSLNFNPSFGSCVMEARVTNITATTLRGMFIGWTADATTDNYASITLATTVFTTTAANAVGFVRDTDATTDTIYCIGVKTNTDTAAVDSGVTMAAAGTWQTFRVEVSVDGDAVFSINGKEVARIADAITANTDICATVANKTSSAAAVIMDCDYIYAEGSRE